MNTRDSDHIIAELQEKKGFETTENPKEADLIILNTCSVREKPERRLFSEIGAYNAIKKNGAKIGVCGCSASALGEAIFKKAPSVDFVLGARNVSKITQVLERPKALEIALNHDESTYDFAAATQNDAKALINISIGCDKKCSYCIVPFTRGEEISIPMDLILREVRFRVERGAKEIILLGQNVNNYGRRFSVAHKKVNFAQLLRAVSEVFGVERIRFISPHPLHMDDEFIEEFAANPKIAKYIHMPLQSGSSRILKAMRRGYTKEWFIERANKIKSRCGAAIGTDIIVGFPGESEADFYESLEVVKAIEFDTLYSFIYSPRAGTEAFGLPEIEPKIAQNRLEILQNLHKQILEKKAKNEVGRIHKILIERVEGGFVEGRSDNNRVIRVEVLGGGNSGGESSGEGGENGGGGGKKSDKNGAKNSGESCTEPHVESCGGESSSGESLALQSPKNPAQKPAAAKKSPAPKVGDFCDVIITHSQNGGLFGRFA